MTLTKRDNGWHPTNKAMDRAARAECDRIFEWLETLVNIPINGQMLVRDDGVTPLRLVPVAPPSNAVN